MPLLFILSCKGDVKSVSAEAGQKAPEGNAQAVPQPKQVERTFDLPGMPPHVFRKMFEEVDYIDYLWKDLPFSVSLDDKQGVQSNVALISRDRLEKITVTCRPIGRKFYNIKGNEFMVADVYFSSDCAFYIFLEGEKPIYANKMTDAGFAFYTNIINQAKNQEKSNLQPVKSN